MGRVLVPSSDEDFKALLTDAVFISFEERKINR